MQRQRPTVPTDHGFTLVEIMVVIVILGLLATIVGTSVLGKSAKAEIKSAEMDIIAIKDTVSLYMVENRRQLPDWQALITPDASGHRYIEREDPKLDPWGHEYEIREDDNHQPLIVSYGPDGIENTEDDITSKTVTQNKGH